MWQYRGSTRWETDLSNLGGFLRIFILGLKSHVSLSTKGFNSHFSRILFVRYERLLPMPIICVWFSIFQALDIIYVLFKPSSAINMILPLFHRWGKWGFQRLAGCLTKVTKSSDVNPGLTGYPGCCFKHLPAFGTSHSDGCQELSLPDSACEHPSAPPSPSLCHSVLKWALLGVIQRVGSPQFSKSNQILFIQESTSVCR